MIVISDTSPIVNLAAIGFLHLLPDLFEEVVIPHYVYHEIVVKGKGEPGATEIAEANWIKVLEVQQNAFLDTLLKELDRGEAEAIVLAIELKVDTILMDESIGRRIAQSYQLRPLGVLGILLRAKQMDKIISVSVLMDALLHQAHFYIDKQLYAFVKECAGEV